MTFELRYNNSVVKFFKKSDKNLVRRIINKLKEVKEEPFRFLEHYEGDYYKLRIGDYRALIDIDFDEKILYIRVIDKRGRVYENNK